MTDYSNTVFLPRTEFVLKRLLSSEEEVTLAAWRKGELHRKRSELRAGAASFVLHDGPPYANGNLHIGHALNKILKDVVNRAAWMNGRSVEYVPGWDCHGLPIEWKVEEELKVQGLDKNSIPVLQFRAMCREYAAKWMSVQRDEFMRLGIDGNWDNRYATMDYASEAAIAGEIGRFLMNGSLYRSLRPVMWSPAERTALADAEVEYQDVTSPTVFASFPVESSPVARLEGSNVIIWTTTPWTLPGNRAVAYGPDILYNLVEVREGAQPEWMRFLVASTLLPKLADTFGLTSYAIVDGFTGDELQGTVLKHPLHGWTGGEGAYDFAVPMLPGSFVSEEAGTGFVHIAPAHGEDDFLLGREHGLPVPEIVGDNGLYTVQAPGFTGGHVFKGHVPVTEALALCGTLVVKGTVKHSLPHSWRSKKPVFLRATPQWFIALDDSNRIRERSLQALKEVCFLPAEGRNRLESMVEARPDWCISRQRAWGVPITVFVHKATGEVLRDPMVLERVLSSFRESGADAWYETGAAALYLGPDRDPDDYEMVTDIVDVWFESGSTHAFVLRDRGVKRPADLYLEGSDQHRGWFQSSLLECVGTEGYAPYRNLLTHGFVLDGGGRKMSKSAGNVTAPQEIVSEYGADLLRLWVMNSDFSEDLRIGSAIMKQQNELYRRLRNTLRFLLGGLYGFSEDEVLPYAALPKVERMLLRRVASLQRRVNKAAENHEWSGVYPALHAFCASDLSSFYFDVSKDSLYCDAADNPRRRAVRTVLDIVHRFLCTALAPVLVFTAEEAWQSRFGQESSVHLQNFTTVEPEWETDEPGTADTVFEAVMRERSRINGALERARGTLFTGSNLAASVNASMVPGLLSDREWEDVLIVSRFTSASEGTLVVEAVPGDKCERCRKVFPAAEHGHVYPDLCLRCERVVVHETGIDNQN